ncbi:Sterol-4-alpha-carboxylate 3-dehydrogenase [Diplonema papillatum]|nr:Sterol-4-alpha-carboxylate 3-dehydrogenase [Diplonema papillatum]|eukprot:gene712-1087_t
MDGITKVFLTGGSGYVGRNLTRALVEQGVEVHAICRSKKAEQIVEGCGGKPFRADLNDVDAMTEAAKGCSHAVHCAACVQMAGNLEYSRVVNVLGTENVIQTCKAAGVRRLVHVSTEAACLDKDAHPLVNLDESTPLPTHPFQAVYSTTKNEAEKVALAGNSEDLEVIVVRPRFIWGRDDTVLLDGLMKAAQQGVLKWFSGGHYLTSTCHVANVAEGIELALLKGVPGQCYFLTDGAPVVFKEFVSELLLAAGCEPPTASVRLSIAWTAAFVMECLSTKPMVTRQALALVGQTMTVRDVKARRDLGYKSRITREAGIAEIREAYQTQPRPRWMPDGEAPECFGCDAVFTFSNRRHHCRACGKIFCGHCLPKNMPMAHLSYAAPQKCCRACRETLKANSHEPTPSPTASKPPSKFDNQERLNM